MTFPKSFQVGGAGLLTVRNLTAAYTVQPSDNNAILNFTNTATVTVSLTAAAVLGSGFNVQIISNGTGTLIIDPNGSETIDSNTTWRITKGQGINILCNGTNFYTIAIRTSGQSANSVALGNNSSAAPSVVTTNEGSVALGGSYATGTDSFAAAMGNNGAYGATGVNCIALGGSPTSSATFSSAIGGSGNIASANRSTALGGIDNQATTTYAYAFGFRALAAYVGKYAYGVFTSGTAGDSQGGYMVLAISTTDATATKLGSDGGAGGATNQVILANNQAMVVTGSILCRQKVADSDKASGWTFSAVIRRGANAGTTTLVAAVTPVLVAQDVSLATTAVSVTADTTNGGLSITVTGIAATNLRWIATVNSSEMVYA